MSRRLLAAKWTGILMAGLMLPTAVFAEDCVTLTALPPTASLTVKSSRVLSSRSPMSYCDVVPGQEYLLSVFSPGYESRSMRFSLSPNGEKLVFKGDRFQYVLRSAIIPGAGIAAQNRLARGAWILSLNLLGAYGLVRSYTDFDDARDNAAQLRRRVALAQTVPEAEAIAFQASAAELESDALQAHFYGTALLAGWVYTANLLETYLLATPPRVRSNLGSSATVETPMVTSKRALWRSLFFPGLGQTYLGHNMRAFFFQTLFVAGASFTLDAKLDYDRATNDVDLAVSEFNNAQTDAERRDALDSITHATDVQQDKKTRRDVFFIVTGSVWLLNVVDAAFSKTPMEFGGMGLQTSYRRSTMWTSVTIKF